MLKFTTSPPSLFLLLLLKYYIIFIGPSSLNVVNSFQLHRQYPFSIQHQRIRNSKTFHTFRDHTYHHKLRHRHGPLLYQSFDPENKDSSNSPLENNDKNEASIFGQNYKSSRRSFLSSLVIPTSALLTANMQPSIKPANAGGKPGLVQFPCKNGLGNTYHFMRAGQSLLEADDVWTTNPLFLTNREAALSDVGIAQVEETCKLIEEKGITLTFVKYSFAAAAMDSANIVGKDLKVGRDRLVPEFFFMDPRAVGMWDMATLSVTEPASWALDVDEAGPYGEGGTPPPNEDGTPNETLSTQVVRLTQLMSAMETQYSGDSILLIFPDGTSPALLTALIGGIPLNRVHEMNFEPGEVRFNITYESSRLQIPNPTSSDFVSTDEAYLKKVQLGREELQKLRDNPDEVINVKDLKYEEILKEEEEKAAVIAKAQAEKKAEEEKVRLDELEAERLRQEERKKQREMKQKSKSMSVSSERDSNDNNIGTFVLAVGALGALGAASTMSQDDFNEIESLEKDKNIVTNIDDAKSAMIEEITSPDLDISGDLSKDAVKEMEKSKIVMPIMDMEENDTMIESMSSPDLDISGDLSKTAVKDVEERKDVKPLLDMNKKSSDLFSDIIADSKSNSNNNGGLYGDILKEKEDPEDVVKKAMEDYLNQDDGGDAWLGMLSDMVETDDDMEPAQD